jgi:anti-anti-sigma regulatory factor
MKFEGKITGPWVTELSRIWKEQASSLAARKLILDLRDVTYSDSRGTQVLREIYDQTEAEILSGSAWTHFLAEQVMSDATQTVDQGS